MNAPTIPEGMMEDAKGNFTPISKIEDVDLARDQTVNEVAEMALELQAVITKTKVEMLNELNAFIALSLETYGIKQGGKKGNISLFSYDGRFKIQIAQQENVIFDERLQGAKQLIDECVIEWSGDSSDNVKALINHAFQVDKEGKINTNRILGLLKLKIADPKWQQAMKAIIDSRQTSMTKEYVRVYERDETGKYQAIKLDFAGV